MSERKLPAFQFYPNDWKSDLGIRSSSLESRGLWVELICLMHSGTPYGHLTINGKPIDDKHIWKLVGGTPNETKRGLKELEQNNVFSRDSKGIIYCRRMVRDAADRELNRKAGAMGGNPDLVLHYNKPGYIYAIRRKSDLGIKIGIAQNPTHRLYKLRQKMKSDQLTLLESWPVEDMGFAENASHRLFEAKRIVGEWFKLNDSDLLSLSLTLKGQSKATPPSSSSSSSAVQLPPLPPPSGGSEFPQTSQGQSPGSLRARGINPRAIDRKIQKATDKERSKVRPWDYEKQVKDDEIYDPDKDGRFAEEKHATA